MILSFIFKSIDNSFFLMCLRPGVYFMGYHSLQWGFDLEKTVNVMGDVLDEHVNLFLELTFILINRSDDSYFYLARQVGDIGVDLLSREAFLGWG